ncbi:ABC transporter ATP-binding protein [Enterococcus sp. 669A]|uniref:ABC transporter ATP-binding protein n=1 Tax=Candidatus Enterococcus moelleringii TaxID=2815325 RepID=A0ABS3L9X7_9ENTE|nr:ABC transporter ATP-binding protein [Enterococcus sp. 669A]MBO1306407.1 ABC transporter ATP-binding protein [Enterococcus sp. 669A]
MKDRSLIRWLLGFARPFIGKMTLAIFLGILSNLSVVAISMIAVWTVFRLLNQQAVNLSVILGVLIACGVLRGVARYAEQYLNHDIAFRLLALIREDIFSTLRKMGPAYLSGKNSGDLITAISTDVEALEVFFAHTISPVFIALGTTVITFGFMAFFDWRMALILLLGQLLIGVIIPLISYNRNRSIGDDYQTAFVAVNQTIMENMNSLKDIAQYQLAQQRTGQLLSDSQRLNQQNKKRILHASSLQAFSEGVVVFTTLGILLFGFYSIANPLTLTLAAVLSLSSFGPVLALGNLGNALLTTFSSGRRLYQLVHVTPSVQFDPEGQEPAEFQQTALAQVTFSYPETKQKVLQQLSLNVNKGDRIGISGESGSGKSTLLKLVMRYWDPDNGKITLNQLPIARVTEPALHQLQGVMEQTTFLFEDTIANNISMKRAVSQSAIEQAAQDAAIHEWILSLPQGYETRLSQLSRNISDGERQRIGLARLFLYDAPLILLDEPTSNLDYVNEQAILATLDKKLTDKTLLIVSHRETTLDIADQTYRVEKGHLLKN